MEFRVWLQQQMDAKGMDQTRLAEASGVPQPTINRILTGVTKDPRGSTIEALRQCLGRMQDIPASGFASAARPSGSRASHPQHSVPLANEPASPGYPSGMPNLGPGNLLKDIRPVRPWDHEEELPPEDYLFLPELELKLSAGNGTIAWAINETGNRQAFRKAWAQRVGIRPESAATMVASGDSMEPRICDGDSLVVDYKAREIIHGKVYAICWQSEFFVKRLFKMPGGSISIHSDNEGKYRPIAVPPEHLHELQIIGRVVAISGGL